MDSQCLVQRPVERSAVITELLPQPLLRLSLNKVGRRRTGTLPLLLRTCRGSGVRRRGSGTIGRPPQRCAIVVPHHECSRRGLGG
jgi:hypothetical protein